MKNLEGFCDSIFYIVKTSKNGKIDITANELLELEKMQADVKVDIPHEKQLNNVTGFLYKKDTGETHDPIMFLRNGELVWSSPSKELFDWVLHLSQNLNARLRDDRYRTYISMEETYIHDDDRKLVSESESIATAINESALKKKRAMLYVKIAYMSSLVFGAIYLILKKFGIEL